MNSNLKRIAKKCIDYFGEENVDTVKFDIEWDYVQLKNVQNLAELNPGSIDCGDAKAAVIQKIYFCACKDSGEEITCWYNLMTRDVEILRKELPMLKYVSLSTYGDDPKKEGKKDNLYHLRYPYTQTDIELMIEKLKAMKSLTLD